MPLKHLLPRCFKAKYRYFPLSSLSLSVPHIISLTSFFNVLAGNVLLKCLQHTEVLRISHSCSVVDVCHRTRRSPPVTFNGCWLIVVIPTVEVYQHRRMFYISTLYFPSWFEFYLNNEQPHSFPCTQKWITFVPTWGECDSSLCDTH